MQRFGIGETAQRLIRPAHRREQPISNLGLSLQLPVHPRGGLVEDPPEHGGVLAEGIGRAHFLEHLVQKPDHFLGLSRCLAGDVSCASRFQRLPGGGDHAQDRSDEHGGNGRHRLVMSSDELAHPMARARRHGQNGVAVEEPAHVIRKAGGRSIAVRAVLLDRLHDDQVEVAPQISSQPVDVNPAALRKGGQLVTRKGTEPGGRPGRFHFADDAADLVVALFPQRLLVEGRLAHHQFIEQHAQAVDVRARVDVHAVGAGLLRTHVRRRADHLPVLGEERLLGQPLVERLGDAEVDHHRRWFAVHQRHEDIRGFDIAMDDTFVVRVLDGLAHHLEELQPFLGGKVLAIAVVGDGNALHVLHHEVGAPGLRRTTIEHAGDIGMIHQRQRLALSLEARDDLPRVHAGLDDLERDSLVVITTMLRQVDHSHAAFAEFVEELVLADD